MEERGEGGEGGGWGGSGGRRGGEGASVGRGGGARGRRGVGRMRGDVGWFVCELKEGALYVVLHGDVNVALVVVPIECKSAVESAGPVNGEFIVCLECINEMLGVGLGEVFDSKVIDAEDESRAFCAVGPEAWSERSGLFDELIERDNGSLFKTIHSAADLEIDVAIGGNFDVVSWIVPNFLGDNGRVDAHVLVVGHGRAEEVLLDVKNQEAGALAGVRNCAVDVELGIKHGDGG